MENIIGSLVGVFIGAIITYFFNVLIEKKSLKNKVYIEIYEQIIKRIDKACKSAQYIKKHKVSDKLERQYEKPTNYKEILDETNKDVRNLLATSREKADELIDFNLYLNYHHIPLSKHNQKIKDINDKGIYISQKVLQQEKLYNSIVSEIGYIKIDDIQWNEFMKNENDIEKCVDEYINQTLMFSEDIQRKYYKDLLKIRIEKEK